jgi:tRNA(Ile)-lysidine synthase TilS/MesJ
MMATRSTTTECLRCGAQLTHPRWSFCHSCWRQIRAERNSWHHQLETWSRQRFDSAQLLELHQLKTADLVRLR